MTWLVLFVVCFWVFFFCFFLGCRLELYIVKYPKMPSRMKHLKQVDLVGEGSCGLFIIIVVVIVLFCFMFLTSLSVCGRPLEFFLFIKLFM